MHVVEAEVVPIACRMLPTRLHGRFILTLSRGAEGGAEGAALVFVEIDDGMIGVKNQIVVLPGPLHGTHQSCRLRDLSLMSS